MPAGIAVLTKGRLPLWVTIGVLVLLSASEAHASTPITSCGQTVTTDAVLTQDLVCTADGIVVGASKITIDLNGHSIRGDHGSGDYGVDDTAGYDEVTVENGVVRNFDLGIWTAGDLITVSHVVTSGNQSSGIYMTGASARVVSSTASGNAQTGIDVTGASATIVSSTAAANGCGGIYVSGASAAIQSSTASGNLCSGIAAYGVSATVKSSTASGNQLVGISVGGDDATLKGNHADANGMAGGNSDLSGLGIDVAYSSTGPHGANTARGNDDPAECKPASLC